jgi:hypothetical protein
MLQDAIMQVTALDDDGNGRPLHYDRLRGLRQEDVRLGYIRENGFWADCALTSFGLCMMLGFVIFIYFYFVSRGEGSGDGVGWGR